MPGGGGCGKEAGWRRRKAVVWKNAIHGIHTDMLVITPAAIGGAVDISVEEGDNLSDSSG